MRRDELETYLKQYLDIAQFKDYCPNGLQVEGRDEIRTIVTGVTASLEMLYAADAASADAVFVHHGYFWRGEDTRLIGLRRQRVSFLLARDLNLFAYHLPLDVHPEIGNNAQLARKLGWKQTGTFGEQNIGMVGVPEKVGIRLGKLVEQITDVLERDPLVIGESSRTINKIAWCTGAAQGYFEEAIAAGADVYVSGEISEQTVHMAHESGVAYISAGHHATERYGIQALGVHLAERFGLTHRFIDIPNPV